MGGCLSILGRFVPKGWANRSTKPTRLRWAAYFSSLGNHMNLKAKNKLQEAEFFLKHMRDTDSTSKDFDYFLNAFIGSCRSVQWVLSSQFNKDPELKLWLEQQPRTDDEQLILKFTNKLRIRSTKIESVKTDKKAIFKFDPSQLSHLPEKEFNLIKRAFESGDCSQLNIKLHHKNEGYSPENQPNGRLFLPASATMAFREVNEFPNQDALVVSEKYFSAMKSLIEKVERRFSENA